MRQRNNEDNLNPNNQGITPPESVDYNEPSPFATDSSGNRGGSPRRSGGGKTNWFIILGVLVVAVVVSYLLASYSYVKVTDDKKNWSGYTTTINQLNADMKTLQTNLTNITTTVNGVSGQVASSIQSGLAGITNQLKADEATLNNLKTQFSTLQNSVDSSNSSVSSFQSSLNDLKTQIKSDSDAVAALKIKVDQLLSDVATLKTQMASVLTPTTTSTATGTTGTGVTATVTGDIFGNMLLNYAGVTNDGVPQTFTFMLNNNTGKTVNNIVLMVGFALMDANKVQINVPTTWVATLSTNNALAPVWGTVQISSGTMAFQSAVGSGIFTDLYNFSQSQGTFNYQLTLILKNTGTVDYSTTQYYLYPIVKVMSYK